MIKLSVIIPVYNGEHFVDKCMEMIQRCKLKNIEFIFVDDGSKDKTADKIKFYLDKDKRLRYVYQDNKGVSVARNNGISYSRGIYISFLDIDDCFEANLYEDLLNEMISYPVDLVIASVKTDNGNKVESRDLGLVTNQYYQVDDHFMSLFMLCEINGSPWNKIYKAEIINKYQIQFDRKISIGEDYLFNLNYLAHTEKIRYIDSSSYLYNIRPNSAMTTYKADKFLIYEKLHEKCLLLIDEAYPLFKCYQQLRYLTWINNSFIDEVCLNPSKSNCSEKISIILECTSVQQLVADCKMLQIQMRLKEKIILNLLKLKSVFWVRTYINIRNLLVRYK